MRILFNDPVIYLIAVYFNSLSSFVYKIIIARILGPAEYGLWNMLSLVLLYGSFLDLGSAFALVKEISFYAGRRDQGQIEEIRNTTFFSVILITGVVSAIALILFLVFNKFNTKLLIIFSIMAFILILNEAKSVILCNFLAEKKFKLLSGIIIFSSFFGILTIILIIKFGLIGLPLGIFARNILLLSYLFKKYGSLFRFQINIKRFLSLVKIGFPIMLFFITFYLFLTIDGVLIFKYMGKVAAGYYGIASALTGFIILLPASLGVFIFPYISERLGAIDEIKSIKAFIYKRTIILAYFVAILLGLIYITLPAAVRMLVPQFAPGIAAARIILIGIFFVSVSIFAQKFLVAINQQLICFLIALLSLFLKALLVYFVIHKNLGIESVATAANIANFVYSISILAYASYRFKETFLESAKYLTRIYFPFVYLLLILFCFGTLKQFSISNSLSKIMLLSIYSLLSAVFIAIPVGYVKKKNLWKEPPL